MRAWRLLLLGVRNSGAAFIKWGQWSATREDLFPQAGAHLLKLCNVYLSSGAPMYEPFRLIPSQTSSSPFLPSIRLLCPYSVCN